MASLKNRLNLATGVLLALQIAGTSLGFLSWWRVQEVCMEQRKIGNERQALLEIARKSRELYVHQAHTFIEGGPGHLDHLAHDAADVYAALDAAEATEGPFPLHLDEVRAILYASNSWFDQEVVPLAQAGTLDRSTATRLHQHAEAQAAQVQSLIERSIQALGTAEMASMVQVRTETRQGWIGVGVVVITGVILASVVSARLAHGILGPINRLRGAVRAFGNREATQVPTDGVAELAELGVAFNDMVSRIQQAEIRLVERERLLALGEIAGAVAHELMSPIMAILSESRMETVDISRIRTEADHARKVIRGLLGFARPGEAEPILVQVKEAAMEAVDRCIPYADARGITLIWKGGPMLSLHAAPTAIRQILDNLIHNAIEASVDGEVEVEIIGDTVEVRDRGAGIPASVRARLYEPFVTGRAEGTGLGLAVSQRIARALGGRLHHEDRAGGGTIARWELKYG